jgi:hypothetical protein
VFLRACYMRPTSGGRHHCTQHTWNRCACDAQERTRQVKFGNTTQKHPHPGTLSKCGTLLYTVAGTTATGHHTLHNTQPCQLANPRVCSPQSPARRPCNTLHSASCQGTALYRAHNKVRDSQTPAPSVLAAANKTNHLRTCKCELHPCGTPPAHCCTGQWMPWLLAHHPLFSTAVGGVTHNTNLCWQPYTGQNLFPPVHDLFPGHCGRLTETTMAPTHAAEHLRKAIMQK